MRSACERVRDEPERRLDRRGRSAAAKTTVPTPDVPARAEPDERARGLERARERADADAASAASRRASASRVGLRRAPRRCRAPSRRRSSASPTRAGRSARGRAATPASSCDGVRAAAGATTKRPISAAFATVPTPIRAPSDQASDEHDHRDDLVREPERERGVLRDPLVEDVPRRQAEARLEEGEDPAGAEEEAGDEPDRARDPPAAQDGSRVHALHATGLRGKGAIRTTRRHGSRRPRAARAEQRSP